MRKTFPDFSAEEIIAFQQEVADKYPAILSPELFAKLINRSRKTIYFWIARGRLDGAFRRRGKHCLIFRDRAIKILFAGKEWQS